MFQELKENLNSFLEKVFDFTNELGIDVSNLEIDHVALRYKDAKDVDTLLEELKPLGKILSQATVNGRKISIIKLNEPFIYKGYTIPCIELPYPAENHDYPNDDWEHVEFVLTTTDIDNFENVFRKSFPNLTEDMLQKYSYSFSIPHADEDQLPNPSVALAKYRGLAIKFHPYSIELVVTSKP